MQLRAPSRAELSSLRFVRTLSTDAALRDAFEEYLGALAAAENSLDRVDETHSLDFQRGKVAALRGLIEFVRALEHSKGDSDGAVQ